MTVSIRDGADRAARFTSFNVYSRRANFWGLKGVPSYGSGRLRGGALAAWEEDRGHITFTVYSYATPIAWHDGTSWVIVDDRFSSSTNRHQNALWPLSDGARHVGFPRALQGLSPAQMELARGLFFERKRGYPDTAIKGATKRTLTALLWRGIATGADYPRRGWILTPELERRLALPGVGWGDRESTPLTRPGRY